MYYALHAGVRVPFLKTNSFGGFCAACQNTKKMTMATIGPEQVALYGLSTNKNNGIYSHGVKFDVMKKLSVEESYQHFKEANGGLGPNLNHIAHDCNVSPNYMKKIEPDNLMRTLMSFSKRSFKNWGKVNRWRV